MGYILLGHGGIHLEPGFTAPEMESVAIPQGTTLQVYSDAGQTLSYGAYDLDRWEQLQAPWGPLDSTQVTYNLVLHNSEESWERELANNPKFGGNIIVRAGRDGVPDPMSMCSGTVDTCPTRPEQVAQGMTHNCDGILGTFQGDLYWLACTSFVAPEGETLEATNAAMGGNSRSVPMGEDPDWLPAEADQHLIARNNWAAVMNAQDNQSFPVLVGGFAFVIGDRHESQHYYYAKFQNSDSFSGTLTVHTDETGKPAWFTVTGVPLYKQDIVRASISLIGAFGVTFQ
ncbi:putative adhesin [Streptomyces sp. NPDC093223]|uniref:putative adhesin n=1 Tax=Streptomyces sp. NPDC093223 TaxID=3366033 RepID=UPI003820D8D8